MSAYLVLKTPIDALVTYALAGHRAVGTCKRLLTDTDSNTPFVSATRYTPSQIGAALWTENLASVNYRYAEDAPPEPYTHRPYRGCSRVTTSRPIFRELAPVEIIALCNSLDYQSCEHPAWNDSFAKDYINRIRMKAIGALPGYVTAARDLKDAA